MEIENKSARILNPKDSNLAVTEEDNQYFLEQSEKNGTIAKARIHYSAQSVNKIPDHYDASHVQFCDCCMFPNAKKGIIEPYSFCDNIKEFSRCGIGTYLYFYFFKYIFVCLLIALVLAAIPSAYFSQKYSDYLFTFCAKNYESYDLCNYYLSKQDASFADWLYQLSFENAKNYKIIAYSISSDMDLVLNSYTSVICDYNLINLITMITMFIINMYVILSMGYLVREADYGQITPSDFTLMISNVDTNFKDAEILISNYLEMISIKPLTVNLTFQLDQYFINKNELYRLQKLYANMKEKNLDSVRIGCTKKLMTRKEVIIQMKDLRQKIKSFLEEIDKLENKSLLNGVVFATFNTNKEYNNYLDQFPSSFFSKIYYNIYYLFAVYFLCCAFSQKSRDNLRKKVKLTVERAPEPQDIIWENLQYSGFQRIKRTCFVYFITFILIGVSFGIVLGLNYVQSNTSKELEDIYLRYGLSIVISVIISVINFLISYILTYLSSVEKMSSYTDFYLTLSLKITIFTFINSALVPLASNNINNKLDQKSTTLINNIFIIFLSNAFVSPLLWLSNIWFFYRKIKQNSFSKRFKDDEPLPITQKELNAIFEKPDMAISFKYSYLAKTMLMCLFYMPLFPLGTAISLVGIFFGYFIEKFNLINTYKRPQMLDSTICMFYLKYFKVFIFSYAIGNWLFLSEVYENNAYALAAIITFGLICIIPVHTFLKCDFLQIKEFDLIDKDYYEYYFDFLRDYERTNPITRKKGNRNYLEKMKEKDLISDEKFRELAQLLNEDNLNVIDAYYNRQSSSYLKLNFNIGKNNNIIKKSNINANFKKNYFKNLMGIDLGTGQTGEENAKELKKSTAILNLAENMTTFYRLPSLANYANAQNKDGAGTAKANIWDKLNQKYSFPNNRDIDITNKNQNNGNVYVNPNIAVSQTYEDAAPNKKVPLPSYYLHNPNVMIELPLVESIHINVENQSHQGAVNPNNNIQSKNDNNNVMYSHSMNNPNNENVLNESASYQHLNPDMNYIQRGQN